MCVYVCVRLCVRARVCVSTLFQHILADKARGITGMYKTIVHFIRIRALYQILSVVREARVGR